MRSGLTALAVLLGVSLQAATYCGRVVNSAGDPLPYATVYPINDPVSGTATNNDGYFTFEAFLAPGSEVVISYIGYEKASVPADSLTAQRNIGVAGATSDSGLTAEGGLIILKEQPIGLEEMIVSANQPKYANKRKQMALLLQAVYEQLQSDWPITPTAYQMVSDVRMDSDDKPWGIEQMIATCVAIPGSPSAQRSYSDSGRTAQRSYSDSGLDSLQFHGEYCKRYFAPAIRKLADSIYTTDILEQMGSQTRKAATAIDSGVVVHKGLFAAGNAKAELGEYMNDVRHWSVNKENDDVTVLTYSVKKNFMLIFRVQYTAHFIVDSRTLRLKRNVEQLDMSVKIPFGIKLDAGQLAMLNMLNLNEQQIDKFRLRQAKANIHFNTLYQSIGEHIYLLEKNLHTDALIIGAKKQTIPLEVNATQRITQVTPNATPLTRDQLTRRLQREIVEI